MIEKIIIDGVDVSGCIDYCKRDKVSCLHLLSDKCSENPNCYYKQLQRATSQYNTVVEQNKSLQTELKQKEQECEELKEYIKKDLAPHAQMLQKKLDSYKQALDEIKKIALNSDVAPCLEHGCDCSTCEDESTTNGERCMQYGLEKILDIINKAKEVNNAG